MADIPFTVVYHSDQDVPSQSDVDRAARFMAMSLHRTSGGRHDIFHDGKRLDFDASDSGRWTNTVPADWVQVPKPPAKIKATPKKVKKKGAAAVSRTTK